VEEMAIASGIHVPQIYILEDEAGINAFVAGTSPNNAALAITQGALDTFNRDELQGVIGHEFSHILNGDMNITMKLISVLTGILLIGKIGKSLSRSSSYARRQHSASYSNNRRSDNKGWAIGLALVGYIGLFFGRLIKAAISRQREFLADASAVQITRNPNGIGEALFAIQSHQNGSLLATPNVKD
jgi:Zn-dependent protease with chaperone function